MNARSTVRLSLLLLTAGLLSACNGGRTAVGSESGPDQAAQEAPLDGAYESTRCFLNTAASAGFGSDVYTQATLTLNADLSGRTQFRLYSDSGCTALLGDGEETTSYEVSKTVGHGVRIVKITQAGSPFWLAVKITAAGAYIHIDGTRGGSVGPYASEPSETDVADFAADPEHVGVFFNRL